MTYSISISGHKDTSGEDESRAFEEDVAAKAEAFVGTLEGVTSATLSGAHVGSVNLKGAE